MVIAFCSPFYKVDFSCIFLLSLPNSRRDCCILIIFVECSESLHTNICFIITFAELKNESSQGNLMPKINGCGDMSK